MAKKKLRLKPPPVSKVKDDVGDEHSRSLEALSYFGTDFDIHGLVRRLKEEDILIPTFDPSSAVGMDLEGFQRKFVWKRAQMIRFVESLLLGFPVPGIFLVQQHDRKLLVLDGQQRLRTLRAFYDNEFSLEEVSADFEGATYKTLDDETRRALDNTFIHATVVKYEEERGDSVYQLFERLNTGGTNLYPQEIRVALYGGKLVSLIRGLNADTNWRDLFGARSPRLKDQELILRFIALYYNADNYERPLKTFLNNFLKDHRNLEGLSPDEIRDLFSRSCRAINSALGSKAFRLTRNVNAAVVDAVMVGVARRLSGRKEPTASRLRTAYNRLVANDEFLSAIGRATADEDRVRIRLERASAAFGAI